jgi:hypothetical protein
MEKEREIKETTLPRSASRDTSSFLGSEIGRLRSISPAGSEGRMQHSSSFSSFSSAVHISTSEYLLALSLLFPQPLVLHLLLFRILRPEFFSVLRTFFPSSSLSEETSTRVSGEPATTAMGRVILILVE